MNLKDIPDRFWKFVDLNGPTPAHLPGLGRCWIWTGAQIGGSVGDRYGAFQSGGRPHTAHRFLYQIVNNVQLTRNQPVDHKCGTRLCVNPRHLQQVTISENQQNRVASRHSKSGIKNVHWNTRANRWVVQVRVDGKYHYGGSFTDIAQAEQIAITLRAKLHPNNLRD